MPALERLCRTEPHLDRPLGDDLRHLAILVRSDRRISDLLRLWVRSRGTALRNRKTSPRLVTEDAGEASKSQHSHHRDGSCDRSNFDTDSSLAMSKT